MDVSSYSTAFHFLCWEGAQNLIFSYMKFEISFQKEWHSVEYKAFTDATKRLFNPSHISKQVDDSLNHQWVSLLAAQHPISSAERVRKIWYFTWNSGLVFSRNHTVWTIRGLCMVFEALPIIVLYLTKDITHSSTNGWHSLQHSIPFLVLRGCPKSDILYEIWD